MSGKFRKRDIERKGSKKEREKDMKLVDENKEDLAHPEKIARELEKVTPVEEIE
ncbi:hypothetical protein [Methanooceanicella nereidis]|uniref:hypothetical protein n=1 Tax=Methanooceanicella nereidis TaxID=2052831 RepID=UPI001E4E6C93|nr:hypothetical protein [Methanocella sp. CWC-04]